MCTWNGISYLPAQLTSIIEQSRKPDELVVCDDGSSDSTRDLLHHFSANADFPVRIIENSTRLGSTANFAKAISMCNGEIIVLSDQDDVWDRKKIAITEDHFQRRPSVGGIFSNAELVDQYGNKLNEFLWNAVGFNARKQNALLRGYGLENLIQSNYVTGATLSFRSVWKNLLLPIPSGWVHDHWIATLLSVATQLEFDQIPLVQYRIHPSQQLGVKSRHRSVAEVLRRAFQIDSAVYHQAAQRSEEVASRFQEFDAVGLLEAVERCRAISSHFQSRGTLSKGRSKGISVIAQEVLNGNYFRYSMGLKSILRDLLWNFNHRTTE